MQNVVPITSVGFNVLALSDCIRSCHVVVSSE
jgi:hypothetical protein